MVNRTAGKYLCLLLMLLSLHAIRLKALLPDIYQKRSLNQKLCMHRLM